MLKKRFSWVRLPNANFRTVYTKNLRNLRDLAPTSERFKPWSKINGLLVVT